MDGKDSDRNKILFSHFLAVGAFGFHTKDYDGRHNAVASACARRPCVLST